MKKILLLAITTLLFFTGCSPSARLTDDLYVTKIYAEEGQFDQLLFDNAYGSLYEDGAGSNITITTANIFYRWTTSTVGISNLTTPSSTWDKITINAGGGGVYRLSVHLSASSDNNDGLLHLAAFNNGTKLSNVSCEGYILNAAQELSIGITGLVEMVAGDEIDLRVSGSHDGEVITVKHAGISLQRISR